MYLSYDYLFNIEHFGLPYWGFEYETRSITLTPPPQKKKKNQKDKTKTEYYIFNTTNRSNIQSWISFCKNK